MERNSKPKLLESCWPVDYITRLENGPSSTGRAKKGISREFFFKLSEKTMHSDSFTVSYQVTLISFNNFNY